MPSNSTKCPLLWLLNLALLAGSVALTMWGTEAASTYIARNVLHKPAITIDEFRRTQPAPYANASYYNEQFLSESLTKAPFIWHTPEGTRLVLPKDLTGTYINVKDGFRTTTNQPASATHTLWLLGGSTTFSAEVPDDATIASQLQKQLPNLKVVNVGATSVNSAQQLERLKTLPVAPSDTVVFYDGVNDISQGIYYGNAQGWIVGTNRSIAGGQNSILERINRKAHYWLPHFFALMGDAKPEIPLTLATEETLATATQETATTHKQNMIEANKFAQSKGATFVHFLQPNLFSHGQLTAYEQSLVANPVLVFAGMEKAFTTGTTALKEQVTELKAAKIASHDLTEVLNTREAGQEYFLDYCHVTDAANARIATAIAEVLNQK